MKVEERRERQLNMNWQLVLYVYISDYENLIEGDGQPLQLPSSFN